MTDPIKCLPSVNCSQVNFFEASKPCINRLQLNLPNGIRCIGGGPDIYPTSNTVACTGLPPGYHVASQLFHSLNSALTNPLYNFWSETTDWILMYTDDDIALKVSGAGATEVSLTHGTITINGVTRTAHRRRYTIDNDLASLYGLSLASDTNTGSTKVSTIWSLYRNNGTDEADLCAGEIFTREHHARCAGLYGFRSRDWTGIDSWYYESSNASGGVGMQSTGDSSLGRETLISDRGIEGCVGWNLYSPTVTRQPALVPRVPISAVAKLCARHDMELHYNIACLDSNATYTDEANAILAAGGTFKVACGGLGNESWNSASTYRDHRGCGLNVATNLGLIAYGPSGATPDLGQREFDPAALAYAGAMYKWYQCVMAFKAVLGADRVIPQLEGQEGEASFYEHPPAKGFNSGQTGYQWWQRPGQLNGETRTVRELMDDNTWCGGNKSRYCVAPYFFFRDPAGNDYFITQGPALEAAGWNSMTDLQRYTGFKKYIDEFNVFYDAYNLPAVMAMCPNGNCELSTYEGGMDLGFFQSMSATGQANTVAFMEGAYGTAIMDYWFKTVMQNKYRRNTYYLQESHFWGLTEFINTPDNNRQMYHNATGYETGTSLDGPFV